MDTANALSAAAGAAALAYVLRYSVRGKLSDILQENPNERPLQFGRTYYRMPDGSIRSRKRDYRRLLMENRGVTSGRQWVRVRKSIPKGLRAFV